MAEGVYKIVELTGSSKKDMEGAVANAVRRAHASLHGLRWFEVTDVRGYIEEGSVSYWQVTVKVGFHVDEKTEPTPPASARKPEQESGRRFVCTVCGYVYDPVRGDPEHGIKPGTRFEDIPDTWTCPVCGVGKDQFVEQRA